MDSTLPILMRLNESGVPYIVIGGMAAILHGSAVGTNDVDICVFASPDHLRQIVAAFMDVHPRYRTRPDKPLLTPEHPWLAQGLKISKPISGNSTF